MTRKEIRKLDSIWSELIRSKQYCERCGRPANQPHHIFMRNNRSTRFDVSNGVLLCFHHHRRAHDNGVEFTYWLTEMRGKKWVDNLRKKSRKTVKYTYEEVLGELTGETKNLNLLGGS